MLLIWVYTREYKFGVYDVDDGCEVYFYGLEGPYSVADGKSVEGERERSTGLTVGL
jgi:hypothetical protein